MPNPTRTPSNIYPGLSYNGAPSAIEWLWVVKSIHVLEDPASEYDRYVNSSHPNQTTKSSNATPRGRQDSSAIQVAQKLKAEPRHQPGLLHGFSDEYFRRVEAVEFAVRHDDGANLRTLHEADIVLTGVSRTSKTPLSMYLAQRGYKTGNVPLVPGVPPPQELLDLDPLKVFGLVIDEVTLVSMRRARLTTLRTSNPSPYTDSESIALELDEARRLFRQKGWLTVDIRGKAVEENAARILEYRQMADFAR